MKKEILIYKVKTVYDIATLLNNTALVYSIDRKSCLVDIKTHELIGNFDSYYTSYYTDTKFYFQEREVANPEKEGWNKKDKYVNIYDAEQEKYIVENYIHISGSYDYAIFQDPTTKKLHLFDMKTIRNEKNIFNEEFDSITTILNTYYGTYTIVEQNGKKGIYKKESGITTPIEYDDIKRINKQEIVVYEKDGKSFFSFHHVNDGIIESPLFDSIECDSENENVLYCKFDKNIAIYDTDSSHRKLLCKFPMFEEIKCLRKCNNGRNIFLVKQNGKYGLYGFDDDNRKYDDIASPPYIEILEPIYDKIETKNGEYYLYKDNKVGLYTTNNNDYRYNECIIEPKYDNIKAIGGTYLLFNKDKCDIVTLDKLDIPHVAKCEYVENHSDDVIYKLHGKYGLYIPFKKEICIINGLDNVNYVSNFKYQNIYTIEKNGKQGVIYNGEELFAPTHESVFIYGVNENNYSNANFYYFRLKDGKYKLAKFYCKDSWSDPELVIQDEEYEDINFYENIMILDNGQEANIYDYNENLLKTCASGTTIECHKLNKNNKDIIIYCIDGENYFYKDGHFEIAFIEDYDLYVTLYQTNTDSFEVSTYNKREYDEFCSSIDLQSDEEAEKILFEMSQESKKCKEKYPTLTLKRVSKLNN